jgi:hypothetical protein
MFTSYFFSRLCLSPQHMEFPKYLMLPLFFFFCCIPFLLRGFKKVKPEIDHKQQARDYEKNVAVRRNISAAAKRKERTLKDAARKKRIERDAARSLNSYTDEMSSFGNDEEGEYGATGGGGGGGDSGLLMMGNTRGVTGLIKLRTAKDVRSKVASERGDSLPDWLISDRTYLPPPSTTATPAQYRGPGSESQGTTPQSKSTQQRPPLVLTHTGAPSAPVLTMPPFPMG